MTMQEFRNKITVKKTEYGLYLQVKTNNCKYGQTYKSGNIEELKDGFTDFYYNFETGERV